MYLSHINPNKLLIVHLDDVYKIGFKNLGDKEKELFYIVSHFHDFGKFTDYFQNYLSGKTEKSTLSNHSYISAIAGYYIADILWGNSINSFIVFNSILHHHGNIESLDNNYIITSKNNVQWNLSEKLESIDTQMNNIIKNKEQILLEYKQILKTDIYNLLTSFIEEYNLELVKRLLYNINKQLVIYISTYNKLDNYFLHQSIYSALVSADKLSASNSPEIISKVLGFNELLEIKNEKFKNNTNSELNIIRNDIFNNVMELLEKVYYKSNIFTITAPTGTGKTYTGFYAALKLNSLLNENRKIIYALPFTSIIEQNYNSILSLLNKCDTVLKSQSEYIMMHHNTAKIEYVTNEYKNINNSQAELLIENWDSGIVITTFVQLLETLISNNNRMLKKMNNILNNSILLLDEVQVLPEKYINIIDKVLEYISAIYNVKIIFMTATKPYLLEKSIELLDNSETYFNKLNRTKLIVNIDKNITIDEFQIRFEKEYTRDSSCLIVCNTIKSSKEIYNRIKNEYNVEYLSANLLPIHKLKKIKDIDDRLKNKENLILVSTQVVEAGVDLDFDIVYRDIAPLPSLIQCAGRSNRNAKNDISNVYIISLVDSNKKLYSSYIYSENQINITKQCLSSKEYLEGEYYNIIDKYYINLKGNISTKFSDDISKALNTLNFSNSTDKLKSIKDFSIIEEYGRKIDIFIEYDNIASEILKKYTKYIIVKDFSIKRNLYLEIKTEIKNYTLSISERYFRDILSLIDTKTYPGLYVLHKELVNQNYTYDEGYIYNHDNLNYEIV